MTIYSGSRYEGASLTEIIFPDGERRPYVHSRLNSGRLARVGAVSTILGSGETLDLLAYRHLGSEDQWWIIADTNDIAFPEIDENDPEGANSLFVGRRLLIPSSGGGGPLSG